MQITFISFISMIFPHSRLHCKLVPVQFREYEYDLVNDITAPVGFFNQSLALSCKTKANVNYFTSENHSINQLSIS